MRARARVLIFGMLTIMFATAAHSQDQSAPSDAKPAAPNASPAASDAKAPTPKPLHVAGNVMAAKVTHQIQPVYPPVAKTAHIEGTVVLHVMIGKDGVPQEVSLVSGPPLLTRSAMDAVRKWRYEPTLLNDEAVVVDTTVSVVFKLSDAGPSDQSGHVDGGKVAAVPPSPQQSAAIDPQYKADVIRLLDAIHYRETVVKAAKASFDSQRSKLSESFPDTPSRDKIVDAFVTRMIDLIQSDKFSDGVIAVYHKYLSDDDVKSLTQFYGTPAGQHFSSVELEMVSDLDRSGNQVARDGIPVVFKSLCSDYPELQGKWKFCPAPPAPSGDTPQTPPSLNAPATPPTNPQ
jgi:TonB family protein